MPVIGNVKYPYTKKGKAAARKYAAKKRGKKAKGGRKKY